MDEATGLCPNCTKPVVPTQPTAPVASSKPVAPVNSVVPVNPVAPTKAQTTKQKKKSSKGLIIKIVAILLALLILVSAGIGTLVYFDVVDIPFISSALDLFGIKSKDDKKSDTQSPVDSETDTNEDSNTNNDNYDFKFDEGDYDKNKMPEIDADEYFEENSEKVISKSYFEDYKSVLTENEVCKLFEKRGFTDIIITSNCTSDGEYYENEEISASSSEKHPIYVAYYVSSDDELWVINIVGDRLTANPFYYNMDSNEETQTLISETESILSYDNITNRYFETIPRDDALIVKVVDIIDCETLENLYDGAIDEL